ncbi:uncharacterized protein LOC123319044 [Coccinella septempunctata]|uniref:uncharacterized protein LOC123319044 n=1 Tax=Coccinella septempunctata TaxID=41139 RepID=UPI001D06A84A|nr:uncharacterized protein LOC123319044 [Coccinella septempunctata]
MVGFIGMAYIITLRMQDLTMHLMEFDERNIQDLEEKFDSLVEYFSEIQKFVKDVNQTFGYCCIVVYVLITVCVALLEYICLVDGSIKNFTFLFGCIGLQYTWCSVGQNLEDEHQKLIYSIEDLPWYNMSPQMKKNYRLFLSSAHMPLQIRIYPHIDVNHKYLLSVFQGSYSITTFLINSSSRR